MNGTNDRHDNVKYIPLLYFYTFVWKFVVLFCISVTSI